MLRSPLNSPHHRLLSMFFILFPPPSLIHLQPLCPFILILRHILKGKHVLVPQWDSDANFSAMPPRRRLFLLLSFLSPSAALHRCPEAHFLSSRATGFGLHVRRQLGRCAQQTSSSRLYSQREYQKEIQYCLTVQHHKMLTSEKRWYTCRDNTLSLFYPRFPLNKSTALICCHELSFLKVWFSALTFQKTISPCDTNPLIYCSPMLIPTQAFPLRVLTKL